LAQTSGVYPGLFSHRVIRRASLLALLLILELLVLSVWLDNASLSRAAGLAWLVGRWGAWTARFVVVFAVFFTIFGYPKARKSLQSTSTLLRETPISWRLLAGHFCSVAAFAGLSVPLYASPSGIPGSLVTGAWLAVGALAVALGGLAFAPPKLWMAAAGATGYAWIYASAAGLLVCLLGAASRLMWAPAAHLTFLMVSTILRTIVPGVIAHPSTQVIGSRGFYLEIAPACSGLEGIGLILVFGATWLWLFRREFRFPHALLLIPAGVVAIFLMNALRITALILIGAAGAPGVAMGGFHSQAGWIAFNAVAVVFALTAQRLPWVTVPSRAAARPVRATENPTTPYLAPFLAILAAAMISRAASSGFEWLYPLRFLAAAGVLWFYRRKYAALDWKFGWNAAATGALVFAMWMGLDWARGGGVGAGIASGLSGLSAPARAGWLTFRTLAAVVTVPIAEELAFRGFLMRRLVSADFESVDWRRFTFFPVLISSVAFGVLHGDRWLAGTIAGVLYAAALHWRGRIGDAVVAHAVTNALLAAWVLTSGNWGLW
jgi:exosortase E/protease (VPEID-CTERM system)